MIQQTSLLAYAEVKPQLGQKQKQVMSAIARADRPVCNRELAKTLNWPINALTPRVHELRRKGKVRMAYKDRDIYGRLVMFWEPVA